MADFLCATSDKTRVAIVIVGIAKKIASPLVYRSIKENVMAAFGGEQVLFTYFVNKNKDGDGTWIYCQVHTSIILLRWMSWIL